MGNLFYEQLQKESDGTIQKMEWISVKERMPEDDLPEESSRYEIRVLVCTAGKKGSVKKVTRSCYGYDQYKKTPVHQRRWYWARDICHVTHWMPLPEPPKEV